MQFPVEGDLDGDVFLLVPFEDPDCNLGCGLFEELHNDPFGDGGEHGEISGGLGCSTLESGHCMTMWLYFDSAVPGTYPFKYTVSDVCGVGSNAIEGRLLVP